SLNGVRTEYARHRADGTTVTSLTATVCRGQDYPCDMPVPQHDSFVDEVGERLRDRVEEIKPRLRGWLHAATAPLALISFLVMLVLAESRTARIGIAVFMISALLLFGVSAVYHTVPWRERVKQVLRRLDHSNIFVMIAGSYTPFSLLLLEPRQATILLTLVWGGA